MTVQKDIKFILFQSKAQLHLLLIELLTPLLSEETPEPVHDYKKLKFIINCCIPQMLTTSSFLDSQFLNDKGIASYPPGKYCKKALYFQ